MAHSDAPEGKWMANGRMNWVASTLHTTSEHGVSSITTAYAHTSTASSRPNWPPSPLFKWTRPFRRKTKSGLCECAITFPTQSNTRFSHVYFIRTCIWYVVGLTIYRGADKSLTRPGRKQATGTKLQLLQATQKKIQKFVRPTRSPIQQWPPRRTKIGDLSIIFSVRSG